MHMPRLSTRVMDRARNFARQRGVNFSVQRVNGDVIVSLSTAFENRIKTVGLPEFIYNIATQHVKGSQIRVQVENNGLVLEDLLKQMETAVAKRDDTIDSLTIAFLTPAVAAQLASSRAQWPVRESLKTYLTTAYSEPLLISQVHGELRARLDALRSEGRFGLLYGAHMTLVGQEVSYAGPWIARFGHYTFRLSVRFLPRPPVVSLQYKGPTASPKTPPSPDVRQRTRSLDDFEGAGLVNV